MRPSRAHPTPPPRPGSSAGEEFRASLDAADGVAGHASAAGGAAEASGVQALTAALRTGELSPAQALDALVAQALQAPDAQRLEPAARAELEQHLRTMLAEDPSLQELTSDLSRT
ncbi:MAG: hypothetical protein IPG81_04970 [Sandaracinaceae bacterium]|nr:hypothetical protein [Sandaracinaceae bacterium]